MPLGQKRELDGSLEWDTFKAHSQKSKKKNACHVGIKNFVSLCVIEGFI